MTPCKSPMEFQDLLNSQPLRAWLKADDITVPAIAKPPDINIAPDRISLAFVGGGAELYAIAIGRKYLVEKAPLLYAEGEVYLQGTTGQLHLFGKTGDIAAQTEETCAIAYLPSKGEAQGLSIVSQITGANQVVVTQGGRVEASTDLTGRHIKFAQFPLIQPPAVSVSQESFEQLEVKLVCTSNNEFYLASILADLIPSSQHIEQERRRIELVYLRDQVVIQKL